jgi:hypothetical protein
LSHLSGRVLMAAAKKKTAAKKAPAKAPAKAKKKK